MADLWKWHAATCVMRSSVKRCAVLGCARIAVAHNADDNVETFLLSLMRGAGLKGLKAMTADNGEIMRPFCLRCLAKT